MKRIEQAAIDYLYKKGYTVSRVVPKDFATPDDLASEIKRDIVGDKVLSDAIEEIREAISRNSDYCFLRYMNYSRVIGGELQDLGYTLSYDVSYMTVYLSGIYKQAYKE